MREQRLVFGEDAELYDRARPGYSDELVTDVLDFAGVEPTECAALEIGAGTGKATVAFAARGVKIDALEPDPAMALVAARHCEQFPRVRILHVGLEDWHGEDKAYDLVFSGQAWHWVRQDLRCTRAASALRRGGTVALFWHRPRWEDDDQVRAALDDAYCRQAPELARRGTTFPGVSSSAARASVDEEIAASDLFEDVTVHHHPWRGVYDASSYLALLASQSDHRLLPEAVRDRLFGAVREVVSDSGGTIEVPYEVLLVLARAAR